MSVSRKSIKLHVEFHLLIWCFQELGIEISQAVCYFALIDIYSIKNLLVISLSSSQIAKALKLQKL